MTWETKKLADVVTLERGFDLPKRARVPGTIPVISSGEVEGTHNQAKVRGPGFAVGRATNLGRPRWSDVDFWPLNTTLYAKDFHGNNARWIYYWFSVTDLSGYDSGSVQPMLNRNYISNIDVAVPSLAEQDRIVDILGALDDKIAANNEAINVADALCESHVVKAAQRSDLYVVLGDELVLNYGKSLPTSQRVPGNIPVIGSSGVVGSHDIPLVSGPSIVLGRKGSIGTLHWIDGPAYPIDTTFWVESKRLPLVFLYYLMKLLDFSHLNTDSAVPGLNRSNAYEVDVPFVNDAVVQEEMSRLESLSAFIGALKQENQTLARTRDELLPLLMTGKITVRDAEEAAVEAGVDKREEESDV